MPVLDWIGKAQVVNHANEVPFHVLEWSYSYGAKGKTKKDNGSENRIIHGDNLVALKSLLPEYEGRVKCIYIDPPYNTGNENWVYNDNVNDPRIKKWLGEVVGKEGEDLSRHDKWLCMMYPRLKLLRRLLADDGAIFISIDDNEQANLKLICDEIFGNRNFVAEIACINSPKGRDKSKNADMATAHEYILVYRKSVLFRMGGFTPDEKIIKRYNKTDEKTGEKFRLIDLRKTGNSDERIDRPNLFYPFFFNKDTGDFFVGKNEMETPNGYIRILPMKTSKIEGRWCWEATTAENEIDKLMPQYQPNKKQWSVFQIDRLDNRSLVTPTTAWTFKDVNSERETEIFQKYLGFQKSDFPNPKPIGTIERILQIATDKDSIILDSFAGSGTTAHAVLNLNKADGGNRKFILVEMMDYADSITAERVRRVIDGYGEGKKKTEGTGGDFSFYEVGEPLFADGALNEDVAEEKIRAYIWYTETHTPYRKPSDGNAVFLGSADGTAYYFHYKKGETTTLDSAFLQSIKTKAERYVIYADVCVLSPNMMEKHGIEFRKIPRDIRKI